MIRSQSGTGGREFALRYGAPSPPRGPTRRRPRHRALSVLEVPHLRDHR